MPRTNLSVNRITWRKLNLGNDTTVRNANLDQGRVNLGETKATSGIFFTASYSVSQTYKIRGTPYKTLI